MVTTEYNTEAQTCKTSNIINLNSQLESNPKYRDALLPHPRAFIIQRRHKVYLWSINNKTPCKVSPLSSATCLAGPPGPRYMKMREPAQAKRAPSHPKHQTASDEQAAGSMR